MRKCPSAALLLALSVALALVRCQATACSAAAVIASDCTTDEFRSSALHIPFDGGDGQTGLAGATLPEPLEVQYWIVTRNIHTAQRDSSVKEDIVINWVVEQGGGSVAPQQTRTDAAGKASVVWTLGPSIGQQVVRATVDGAPNATVVFAATAQSAPPAPTPPTIRVGVSGAGNGNGQVTSSGLPAGDIACTSTAGVKSGVCDESFTDSDGSGTFNLVATPSPGSAFGGWTGCSSSSAGTCVLTYNSTGDVTFSVTARFDLAAATEFIAFESDRDGDDEIYVIKPDGSGLAQLTVDPAADREPAWSPDGSRIAFVSNRSGNYEIYVMNANGSGILNLSGNPANDREPNWSPDGQRIVFWSERDGNREIYVMNADGSGVNRLTNEPSDDEDAAWSPDGRIVFSSGRGGGFFHLYVMNANGTGIQQLTSGATDDEEPSWSPDGARIVFTRTALNATEEIFVMNADGSSPVALTSNGAEDNDPVWSPDGTRIAFMTNRNGSEEIYLMSANGSGLVRLTNTPGANNASPAWVRKP